jgi:hypothetical protein
MSSTVPYYFLGDYEVIAKDPASLAALARLHALALCGYETCANDERDDEDEGLLTHVAEALAFCLRLNGGRGQSAGLRGARREAGRTDARPGDAPRPRQRR